MRERPPKEQVIGNMIAFLKALKSKIEIGDYISLSKLQNLYYVSKQTGRACQDLQIIKKVSPDYYTWEVKDTVYRRLALKILDHILHKNKKQSVTPLLPDFATIANTLQDISANLSISMAKNNNRLQGLKTSDTPEVNLFTYQEQRRRDLVHITAQIATYFYPDNNRQISGGSMGYNLINKYIVSVADDLLKEIELRVAQSDTNEQTVNTHL